MSWDASVAIWKAVSIALTGFFGMLALLTEYKDPTTKKITRWGVISLAGIVLSTVCGVAAQVIDQRKSDNDAIEARDRAEKLARDSKTAAISAASSLIDIRRLLSPVGHIYGDVVYPIPCTNQLFQRVCAKLYHDSKTSTGRRSMDSYFYIKTLPWPHGVPSLTHFGLWLGKCGGQVDNKDVIMQADDSKKSRMVVDGMPMLLDSRNKESPLIEARVAIQLLVPGGVRSMMDLQRCTAKFTMFSDTYTGMKPSIVGIQNDAGDTIEARVATNGSMKFGELKHQ